MLVSIIIPALNEARLIGQTLAALGDQSGPTELIVVDGGSVDATPLLASRQAHVLQSERGRAAQMNAGARTARGEALLFLHADTLLPPQALDLVRHCLSDPACEAGAFRLHFDRPTPLLRFYSACTRFNWPSICFGDRGLFVRRQVFEAIDGFAPLPIFEDLDLIDRLYRRGGFCFLDEAVTTAARRFEQAGPFRQQLRNLLLWSGYRLGLSPARLARHYAYPMPVTVSTPEKYEHPL
jgi:rSAM/selenodomain-associated transferase 2